MIEKLEDDEFIKKNPANKSSLSGILEENIAEND